MILQPQAPQPSVPPPPPIITVRPGGDVSIIGVPQTAQELAALRSTRRELSNQLESAAGRRNDLAEQLKDADPAARVGLEARIRVLDDRIVQLESDMARTGQQLTSAPASVVASTSPARIVAGMPPEGMVAIAIVFTVVVLAPMAFAFARAILRRSKQPVHQALPAEAGQRLERIEQAVEAVAIEVERITEGQRFLTKLLTERSPAALPAGEQRQPQRSPAETIHVRGPGG